MNWFSTPLATLNSLFTFTYPWPGAAAPKPAHVQQLDPQNHLQGIQSPVPVNVPWGYGFGQPQRQIPPQQAQPQPMPHNVPRPPVAPATFRRGDQGHPVFGNRGSANRPPHPGISGPQAPMPLGQAAPYAGAFTSSFPRTAGQPAVPPNHPHVLAPYRGAEISALPRVQPQEPSVAQPAAPHQVQDPFAAAVHPVPRQVPAAPLQGHVPLVHYAPPVEVIAPAPPHSDPAPSFGLAPPRDGLTQRTLDLVREVLPNVEPEYLLGLVNANMDAMKEQTAELIVGALFEMEAIGGYPTAVKAAPAWREPPPQPVAGGSTLGVRVREAGAELPNKKARVETAVNFEDVDREPPSLAYRRLSVYHLRLAFPHLPKNIITSALYQHNGLYAPTYLHLYEKEQGYTSFPVREQRPYRRNATKYCATQERHALIDTWDNQFGQEWAWLECRMGRRGRLGHRYQTLRVSHGAGYLNEAELQDITRKYLDEADIAAHRGYLVQEAAHDGPAQLHNGKWKQRAVEVQMDPQTPAEPADEEGDIECGCCFGEFNFEKMVQCPDAHLFCAGCVSRYAATNLGEHNASLVCMNTSDCRLSFSESELQRVLTPQLMALYGRLVAQQAVAAAGLEDLEECPFCDWKCVIDAPIGVELLFRCENEAGGCGAVSCRKCKRNNHVPKTCEEMEEVQVLDGQHAIEEAMTRALMRNCPNEKCMKAFVKETGCNKMTCPHCRTLSCYICRQIISGYDHFDVMPGAPASTAIAGRCSLWEDVEQRHADEVRDAAEQAARDLRRHNPDIGYNAIKADVPAMPAQAHAVAEHQAALEQQLLIQQLEVIGQRDWEVLNG